METEELKETREGLGESIEELTSHVGEYVETFYKLALIRLTKKATTVASAMVGVVVLCTIGTLVLLFTSMGLAWWLGTEIGNPAGGFFLVAGFWALVLGIALILKKSILFQYFRDIFIKRFNE